VPRVVQEKKQDSERLVLEFDFDPVLTQFSRPRVKLKDSELVKPVPRSTPVACAGSVSQTCPGR